MTLNDLLNQAPKVINIGVRDFAVALSEQEAQVIHVEWQPPREIDPEIEHLLENLL